MRLRSLILLTCMLASLSVVVVAEGRKSLDQAVAEARDRHPGRVLSAERQTEGGRESYSIRILTEDGRVKRLQIDPDSRPERREPR